MIRRPRVSGMMSRLLSCSVACSPRNVSFSADVQPILKKYCLECHMPGGTGFGASGFDMSGYERS